MFALGLAVVKVGLVRKIGIAGAAASTLTVPVFNEEGGSSLLEWILRSLVAVFQIALGWPAGTQFSIADVLLHFFGESIAASIEELLRTVTSIPEIVDALALLLTWAQAAMIVGMFLGIIAYWSVYTNQTSKSQAMEDKIWEGKTLIVDPWSWMWKRLVPISAILVIALRILHTIVNEGFKATVWLVDFIYEGAGTTPGEAFEGTLVNLADSGAFGLFAFLVIIAVLAWKSIKLLIVYARRVVRFILAHFFVLFELGKFLDGRRTTSMADPFKKYLESFLLLAGTVLFVWLAPMAASRFPGLFGAFVLAVMLDIAREYPRLIDRWFKGSFQRLRNRLDSAGDWIDQDLEEARAQAAEPKPSIGKRVVGGAANWTKQQVSDRTPRVIKRAARVGTELVKVDPRVAAGLAAGVAVSATMKDDKKLAREIKRNLTEGRGVPGRKIKSSPRWDRDTVLAKTVAEKEMLFSQIDGLSSDRDFAVFYELARIYHSHTSVERVEVVQARLKAELTDEQVTELAAKGRKVAREALEMRS